MMKYNRLAQVRSPRGYALIQDAVDSIIALKIS